MHCRYQFSSLFSPHIHNLHTTYWFCFSLDSAEYSMICSFKELTIYQKYKHKCAYTHKLFCLFYCLSLSSSTSGEDISGHGCSCIIKYKVTKSVTLGENILAGRETTVHAGNCSTYALPAFSLPTPWAKLARKIITDYIMQRVYLYERST